MKGSRVQTRPRRRDFGWIGFCRSLARSLARSRVCPSGISSRQRPLAQRVPYCTARHSRRRPHRRRGSASRPLVLPPLSHEETRRRRAVRAAHGARGRRCAGAGSRRMRVDRRCWLAPTRAAPTLTGTGPGERRESVRETVGVCASALSRALASLSLSCVLKTQRLEGGRPRLGLWHW